MHTIELFLFFKCYHFLQNRVRQFRRRANFAASLLITFLSTIEERNFPAKKRKFDSTHYTNIAFKVFFLVF